ncbi:MAG TPA: MgtC/SapB family protein [Bryobacteraceae bacterium]|nr:MgtC/SapB family protein [Bryobacteraceae bacterium]
MRELLNGNPEFWKTLGQLALTYALTLLIGWEREQQEHTTGLRTFPLVGIASCAFLLAFGPHPDSGDQSRVLQGLITGIGFVGGGAILKDSATVRGTATAASIWNAGAIGALVAMQHYSIAIILALLNLLTLRALLPLKARIDRGREPDPRD